MSLINVNNAQSITGVVRSVQLSVPGQTTGGRFIDPSHSENEILAAVVASAKWGNPRAHLFNVTAVASTLASMFDGTANLYRIQSNLNMSDFELLHVAAEVEFGLVGTGHGELPPVDEKAVLLVKTTWQK